MSSSFQYSAKPDKEEIHELFLHDPYHFKTQLGTSHEQSINHKHNYMQLWYVLRGSFRHVFNGQDFYQGSGDFIIVPPFCSHIIDTSQSQNVEFIFCDLSDGFLNAFPDSDEKTTLFNLAYLRPLLVNANQMRPFLSFKGESKKQIETIYFELLEEYKKANELSKTHIRSNVLRLLTLVAREYESIAPVEDDALFAKYRAAIQDALDYIDQHYTENITLGEIAKIALMSVRSFSYVFKQITGKTFLEYVHYLRVRQAREFLVDTDYSLTHICCQCGFYDITYFGRVFKKITGMTPSAYRKKYGKQ